ncbi:MAG: nucleotide pyrophosphohydrolase [Chloroflexi bacterium]|nr:nucleotide pyrophosphohydrolase [Chloroflexota bacterium]
MTIDNHQSSIVNSQNWQAHATNFAQKHNLNHPPGVYALDLISELGEVAKEILLATEYGKRPFPNQPIETMSGEMGDALYSLCLLATAVNVDLEEALTVTLQKYESRWQAKGHPGSTE